LGVTCKFLTVFVPLMVLGPSIKKACFSLQIRLFESQEHTLSHKNYYIVLFHHFPSQTRNISINLSRITHFPPNCIYNWRCAATSPPTTHIFTTTTPHSSIRNYKSPSPPNFAASLHHYPTPANPNRNYRKERSPLVTNTSLDSHCIATRHQQQMPHSTMSQAQSYQQQHNGKATSYNPHVPLHYTALQVQIFPLCPGPPPVGPLPALPADTYKENEGRSYREERRDSGWEEMK
jgi:hypothetical protein